MQRRQLLNTTGAAALMTMTTRLRAQSGQAPPPVDGPLGAALRDRLRHEGVGLVAAVADGTAVQFTSAGRLAAGQDRAPDADTRFEYGSVTKTFVALLLADMAMRRELKLDDPVESVLGAIKLRDSAGAPITWADVATHRSGLPRLPPNLQPRDGMDPYADYGSAALHSFLAGWKPEVPRNSRWEYSNLGFGLLGHALALRAGKSFALTMRERVLAPLQLNEIEISTAGSTISNLAPGHDAQARVVSRWQFDALAGAGALVGSARSLVRYAQAATGLIDTPLAPAFALALKERAAGPSAANPIGLAWILAPLNGRRVALHDGGTFGFASTVILDPKQRRAAVLLSNAAGSVNDLAIHAVDPSVAPRDIAAEKGRPAREPVVIDAAALAPLAGEYALNPNFKLFLRLQDGKLLARATGQGEFELFGINPRRFFARVTTLEIHFDGDAGVPAALMLHQGGQKLRFVRE